MQSIKNALRSFMFVELIFLLIFTAIFSLISGGLSVGPIFGLYAALIIGPSFGLIFGLRNGGLATIQHYSLRLILARLDLLPWRLVHFLDHASYLIFLRRVGGGYIFVHRLLMEHFAAMYTEEE